MSQNKEETDLKTKCGFRPLTYSFFKKIIFPTVLIPECVAEETLQSPESFLQ